MASLKKREKVQLTKIKNRIKVCSEKNFLWRKDFGKSPADYDLVDKYQSFMKKKMLAGKRHVAVPVKYRFLNLAPPLDISLTACVESKCNCYKLSVDVVDHRRFRGVLFYGGRKATRLVTSARHVSHRWPVGMCTLNYFPRCTACKRGQIWGRGSSSLPAPTWRRSQRSIQRIWYKGRDSLHGYIRRRLAPPMQGNVVAYKKFKV